MYLKAMGLWPIRTSAVALAMRQRLLVCHLTNSAMTRTMIVTAESMKTSRARCTLCLKHRSMRDDGLSSVQRRYAR